MYMAQGDDLGEEIPAGNGDVTKSKPAVLASCLGPWSQTQG